MKNSILLCLINLLAATAIASPLPQQPHIYVEGSAQVEVEPDTITFSVELEKTLPELEAAKKDVDLRSIKLIQTCKELAIPTANISTTALRIYPSFTYRNGEQIPNGTSVSRRVDIKLQDLSRYGEVMKALVDAQISKTVSTQLSVSKEKESTDKALEAAQEDAKQRARMIARSQGKRLADVYSISEFMDRREEVYQLTPARSIAGQSSSELKAEMSSLMRVGGTEPFEPGRMVATAKVYVVYLLK
ncbi:SIMPL domain-containing protein [Teredinibacter sp. KSP-S5-2]|uniref:SIMPL domain-containing protein n=1 Tax=Teredinibacter sp. KSP-S5-2 TaxID=3034506 RepID=UPI0029341EF2|nr:SIMPL domain-containing protein [Teredinibacter sp. KSP-S5-2]WNO09677.1 SIMPL domain-containing protein [Teredinibacter sp. KSP-S5-2]